MPTTNRMQPAKDTTRLFMVATVKRGQSGKVAEKYVFIFAPSQRHLLRSAILSFAANPDLSFTYYDAAVLDREVKKLLDA